MSGSDVAQDNRPPERTTLAAFRPTPKEIGALVCAALPFAVFVGSTNRVVVNGQVVRDESFNLLGVILALVALGLALSAWRALGDKFLRGPKPLHQALIAGTGLLALVQLARSSGML